MAEPLEQTGELAWPEFIKTRVVASITRSSVTDRLDFLNHSLLIRLRRKDLPTEALPALLHLVFLTYSRYHDRESRQAIIEVLKALDNWNPDHFQKTIAPALVKESEKAGKRSSTNECITTAADRFNLLTWVDLLIQCVLKSSSNNASLLTPLINAQAILLDTLVDDKRKRTIAKSALADVRRTIRQHASSIPTLFESAFANAATATPSYRNAVLVGTLVDVSLRLKKKGVDGRALIDQQKITDYYLKNVVSARTAAPTPVLDAFGDFIQTFVDQDTFTKDFLPTFDKMMLRSPDIASRALARIIPKLSFDPSTIFATKWLEPVLNQLRASSLATRSAATELWEALSIRCGDMEQLLKVVTTVTKTLTTGKVSSWEHRVLTFNALSALAQADDPSISEKALEGYFTMVSKESNEQAMAAAIDGAGRHLTVLIYNDAYCEAHKEVVTKTVKTSSEGLKSAKAAARKSWAVAFGNTIWAKHQPSETLNANVMSYLQNLFTTFNKIVDKPLVWKDGPLEAYILIGAVSGRIQQWPAVPPPVTDLLKKNKYPEGSLLITSPKPSFLLWDRIYTKAVTPGEGLWLVRALTSVFGQESQASLEKTGAGLFAAQALIWTLSSHPEHTVRRAAFQETAALAKADAGKLGAFMKTALSQWLLDLENDTKDSTAMIAKSMDNYREDVATYRTASVLNAITAFDKDYSSEAREKELVELMILAHHKYIASPTDKYNWITLMQRAGVNPGKLVKNQESNIMKHLKDAFVLREKSQLFYEAALSAISTLVFIRPEMIPLFVGLASENLDAKLMDGINETEYGIWQTPEDQVYVDVLNKNKKTVTENRNRKGYDDDQWEQELRAELAKKKGMTTTKKLTKEEQTAVNAQRKKEAEIRQHVQHVHHQLLLGLQIIHALVSGNRQDLVDDLVALVSTLLAIAKAHGGLLVGDKIVNTFLELGDCVVDDIYSIRHAIALTTLRANKISSIPSRWLDESLGDLVNRVLYRLRFVTESRPLEAPSFGYCFPVLQQVIYQGAIGVGKSDTEAALEQVIMAVDIIGFHCARGGSSSVMPKKDMIASLLYSIKEYPQCTKSAKTSLITLCESMEDDQDNRQEIDTLLHGLLSDETLVRNAALSALDLLDLTDIDYSPELWLASHDANEQNAELADTLWNDYAMDVEENYKDQLLEYAISESNYIRTSASKAIADAMEEYPETVIDTLEAVYTLYKEKAKSLDPEYDRFGMVIPETVNRKDPWESRVGLALTLKEAAPYVGLENVPRLCTFLIQNEALGDRNETVRKQMLEAGLASVNAYGKEGAQDLLATFEGYLNTKAPNTETHDHIRQSVVILYGGAAGFLEQGDPKVQMAVDKLIATLDTPSEVVQSAVADCLPPLIKKIKENVPQFIDTLTDKMFNGEKYAERRGAAYGLAGVVKGRGITALKECNVMATLKDAIESKKMYQHRQGALFAFETLSAMLGRLFEPYIIQIVPLLLVCFSDSNMDVREAASDAARVIMSKISGHCVKLILPSILEGLEERQWRTKKASVELLGATAYCAPKQLSVSLPNIIPRITEVLADTHPQVQGAANRSLQLFGEVISNPEIQLLVPVLLDALSDPNRKTMKALSALLQTSFVHYIDPPSLALVMPILERGLRERGTEVKTKATQIVGNMASLTDQRDLVPYLPVLLPGVKQVLVDPVPEARGTAAKALGGLVEKLGEDNFPDLVVELLDTLKSDSGGVDRQGAAQGLSEVLAGLGLERMDGLLPEIIANADSPRPYVREGFISLLIYLPATFGGRFQPYLGRIIPPILMGLADESEFVRDASLRAGRMIVVNYATKAVDLLLPELEKGLFDNNWRIRQSSVQLVGDLLFRITGTTNPKNALHSLGNEDEIKEDDDEDYVGAGGEGKKQLVDILGKERRDRILAALYIIRQDTSGLVRQASLHVWKALVSNTPRTLKEILPVMMSMIIKNLASASYEQRTVAARTLGELVQKLGEGVLAEILPILEEGMSNMSDEDTRQGVTIAFSEIMMTAGKVQILDFADQIIPTIRKALCDPSEEVREAAAQAFDTLHQNVGSRAIDEILPALLNQLQSSTEDSVYALSALKEIMAVRSNVVFPVLIPTLVTVPITAFNARALASLVTVAGSALNRRLTTILSAIVESRMIEKDEEVQQELKNTTEQLLISLDEDDGMHSLISTLQDYVRSDKVGKRAVACDIVGMLYQDTKLDASEYVPDWIGTLVPLLSDGSMEVVKAAWQALNAVTKSVKKDDYEELVNPVRQAVRNVGVPGADVPGFCLPKGISPILPIFLQGLMYGTSQTREQAALGVGDLLNRTSTDALKPFVTQITGPLIRIVGDRYPPQVKAAILQTLSLLLTKVPMHLKPFLPQLQRTFIKSLSDPSSAVVRSRAASALGILITLQTRVDPLVSELVSGIRTSEPAIKETMMDALQMVVAKTAKDMSDVSKRGVMSVITEGLADQAEPGMMVAAARLLGSLCKALSLKDAEPIVHEHVLSSAAPQYGAVLSINALLIDLPTLLEDMECVDQVIDFVIDAMTSASGSDDIPEAAITAAGKFLMTEYYQNEEIIQKLVQALTDVISSTEAGVGERKRVALVVLRAVARKHAYVS
ncbi:armadillo-type protein [Phascolomyces articulosus]|uniref:eIF-2-alpha kinase activator GCN1 n=1 Tax=Phascolomyces articulosus TaxID=60185 RepID=A0AAD5K8T4_9FUNG|nr:armadillo-type protein [Phascolomyces articulosus]